ncbi:MAG: YbaK/EbsC family protein [Syntrophomonadaceae bacterium]|jgi:prolyl-tRNA editing enzyme YbaK/EbsC (Cys-tRNA(Pro) deacylase)
MNEVERVRAYLAEREPHLKIINLDTDTSTAYLAAQALGIEVAQIAKSILLKTKNNEFFMVVASGDARIDNKAVKNLMGSRVRMASGDEVLKITGFSIGGVCPFALENDIPIYIDKSLQRFDIVYTAAGTSNTILPITFNQLCNITKSNPCDVCQVG